MSKKCVVLTSSMANQLGTVNQRNMLDKLAAKRIEFEEVEAVNTDHHDRRNALTEISGKKGEFPQLFFEADGKTTYFGGIEEFNDLFETDSLPKDVLDKNPDLPTFTRVFDGVARKG